MRARDQLLRQALRERFVVTLRTGEAFDGLLLEVDDKTVVLANARTTVNAQSHPVDGLVYLPREQISYMQKLGAGE